MKVFAALVVVALAVTSSYADTTNRLRATAYDDETDKVTEVDTKDGKVVEEEEEDDLLVDLDDVFGTDGSYGKINILDLIGSGDGKVSLDEILEAFGESSDLDDQWTHKGRKDSDFDSDDSDSWSSKSKGKYNDATESDDSDSDSDSVLPRQSSKSKGYANEDESTIKDNFDDMTKNYPMFKGVSYDVDGKKFGEESWSSQTSNGDDYDKGGKSKGYSTSDDTDDSYSSTNVKGGKYQAEVDETDDTVVSGKTDTDTNVKGLYTDDYTGNQDSKSTNVKGGKFQAEAEDTGDAGSN